MVSGELFFEHLKMNSESFKAVETIPHFPVLPETCYIHPPLPDSDGSSFEELLDRFCTATPEDRELIRAFYLTLFWGGKPGTRPAWLITGPDDDPKGGVGIGKSTFIELASTLVGGFIDVTLGEDIASVKKRLLSPNARQHRMVRIDNIKAKVNWADLEALITSPVISGHKLFTGESCRPNHLIWCLTLNAASLSRDMAARCMIIQLQRPTNSPDWATETMQFIQDHKWQIITDIRHALS